jgi:hypothetical protein
MESNEEILLNSNNPENTVILRYEESASYETDALYLSMTGVFKRL